MCPIAANRPTSDRDCAHLLLGSRAFTGIARSVLHLLRDPDDDDRRLLLPGKSNLSKPAPGLAFRIDGDPARLTWEPGAVDLTADGVVSALAAGGSGHTERDEAADFLRDLLADGPKFTRDVDAAAREAGHKAATIRRARAALGIKPQKLADGWMLALPGTGGDDEGAQPPQDAHQGAQPQPSERLREKPAENPELRPKALTSGGVSIFDAHGRAV